LKTRADVLRLIIDTSFRHSVEPKHPERTVDRDRRLPQQLGQPAGGKSAAEVHLPEAVLRMDESLRKEEVVKVLCEEVRDAPAIASYLDLGMQTGQMEFPPHGGLPAS
jgi:hypothetical protein